MSINDETTMERELRPLRAIPDNYPKTVITYDRFLLDDVDGIRIVNVLDWLKEFSEQQHTLTVSRPGIRHG